MNWMQCVRGVMFSTIVVIAAWLEWLAIGAIVELLPWEW